MGFFYGVWGGRKPSENALDFEDVDRGMFCLGELTW